MCVGLYSRKISILPFYLSESQFRMKLETADKKPPDSIGYIVWYNSCIWDFLHYLFPQNLNSGNSETQNVKKWKENVLRKLQLKNV